MKNYTNIKELLEDLRAEDTTVLEEIVAEVNSSDFSSYGYNSLKNYFEQNT